MVIGVDPLSDRRREIRDRLKEALRDPDFYRLVERDCLDDISACQPTTSLEVALFALPYRQRRALVLCYGPDGEDMTQEHIGSLLGVTDRTVRDYCRLGIEAMINQIWRK